MFELQHCPGTLAEGFDGYSRSSQKAMFDGRNVSPFLPYPAPSGEEGPDSVWSLSRQALALSGIQDKYPMVLEKKRLRPARPGEEAGYIVKLRPKGKGAEVRFAADMPANEHLTMQIARQVYGIPTAANALVFFEGGEPGYLCRRFDLDEHGNPLAVEDFTSLLGKSPKTDGPHYKYSGQYLDLFLVMEKTMPAWRVEAVKLLRLLLFNYLFSNGDAHLKNFCALESPWGDYTLSPAFDLINSRLHVNDKDFALDHGLLPSGFVRGGIGQQFHTLAEMSGISDSIWQSVTNRFFVQQAGVVQMIKASYLAEEAKRVYFQEYLFRLQRLQRS